MKSMTTDVEWLKSMAEVLVEMAAGGWARYEQGYPKPICEFCGQVVSVVGRMRMCFVESATAVSSIAERMVAPGSFPK